MYKQGMIPFLRKGENVSKKPVSLFELAFHGYLDERENPLSYCLKSVNKS